MDLFVEKGVVKEIKELPDHSPRNKEKVRYWFRLENGKMFVDNGRCPVVEGDKVAVSYEKDKTGKWNIVRNIHFITDLTEEFEEED
jgi:hypothetical protein